MRKSFLFILLALLVLCSCSQANVDQLGILAFDTSLSRGVSASIDYPTLTNKTWNLTATKADGGADTGAGTYEEIVLTDSIGPFSVGSWAFTITDTTGKWTGSVNAEIKPGVNRISFSIRSTSNQGELSVEGCDFLVSKIGAAVNYVDCYVDEQRINGTEWVVTPAMTEDGDRYVLPTVTTNLPGGIHTIRLYYGADNGGRSSDPVSFRIVNGMTTHITIGEQEGNIMILIAFDIQEALL